MKAKTKKILKLKEIAVEKKAAGSAAASETMTESEKAIVKKINDMDDALGEDVDFVAAVQDVLFCASTGDAELTHTTLTVLTLETMSRMTKIRDKIHELTEFATGNLTGKEKAA